MKKADVYVADTLAGRLEEILSGKKYSFRYFDDYRGPPVSLTMPLERKVFEYEEFPPFFDGVLPEGIQLEGLLKQAKIDRNDYFEQLLSVGGDLVGAVSVRSAE